MFALLGLLTPGVIGGVIGSVTGIFKQWQEKKERIDMARIDIERDKLEYENATKEREYALLMLEKGAEIKLEETKTETEAQMEIAHQDALSKAQKVFTKLKTSSKMDNFRASVRPALAYWIALTFTIFLAWAFFSFNKGIDPDQGLQILMGLIATLEFGVTSIITFYYVGRSNSKSHL